MILIYLYIPKFEYVHQHYKHLNHISSLVEIYLNSC